MAPLIAVGGRRLPAGHVRGWRSDAVGVPGPYLRAVAAAGAQAAVLSPSTVADPPAAAAGLLLIGGGDVDPTLYGQDPHPSCYGVDPDLDRFELGLVRKAIDRRVPILGICRGMQVLNVALGGTLVQDITASGHGDPAGEPQMHAVTLAPASRVASAVGGRRLEGSSSHHQGVGELGKGLVASAWSEDGMVEAIEAPEGWVVGVQWHPERTAANDPAQGALFDHFVHAAGRRASAGA